MGIYQGSLAPPRGKAIALSSIRVAKEEFKSDERYGGKGDKSHLGGFTDMDHHGISPAVWKWMMTYIGVHSLLDVGCGRGISTSWFYFHGADVLCVEGSHDAVENTVIPDTSLIVEHDFSRGPWWPEKTYDAVWCVEFLEHVRINRTKVLFVVMLSCDNMSHSCLFLPSPLLSFTYTHTHTQIMRTYLLLIRWDEICNTIIFKPFASQQ
jgi:2-polyprenyl-3-methyl-5-hydroxy-6-metoxy-1,4-benzoquinol methylase